MKNYLKYIGILALGMVACEPEFENPVDEQGAYENGEADFTNYVALGNSLTAGYADNALYITGQEQSYPNILAQQFAKVQQTEEFRIPYMNDNAGGLLAGDQQITQNRLVLSIIDGDTLPRVYTGMTPTTNVVNGLDGYYNNMGVPGAKSFHLLAPNYGDLTGLMSQPATANPYFVRFASSPSATVVEDAVAQDPTFFSLWIGNNDVLGYATSGGLNEDEITNPQYFTGVYSKIVESLTANGAQGVLLNIPYVTDVPFFTRVPVKAIPLDEQTATMLNTRFVGYNEQILPGLAQMGEISPEEMQQRQINFTAGQNFVTLTDDQLTDITQIIQGPPFNLDEQTANMLGQLRQATSADLIPLTSSGILGTTVGDDPTMINGVSVPLGDQHVLTWGEQNLITNATDQYNQTIKSLAEANGLAFVDAAGMLSEVAGEGIPFDGGTVTSDFVTGGAFSLDGIHLTPRGYALVANRIIEAVNETYNSTVPKVNIGNYGTVTPSNDVK